jgi:hypothetical protein
MINIELSNANLEEYISLFGNRGRATLKILSDNIPYLDAVIGTEPGRSILMSSVSKCLKLMGIAYERELTVDERAELTNLKVFLNEVADTIYKFKAAQTKISEELHAGRRK